MSNVVLNVEKAKKSYKKRVALDSTSFSISKGEIFGLIGPNGAGKTTLLKLITGLAKADEGTITINGLDIKKNFTRAIANVGAIVEEPKFYEKLSGYANLKFFAALYKTKISKDEIAEIVKIVGLENRIGDKVKTYSLGMKQRLGIAQALLNNPSLLILDEPTNGLDPYGIAEMRSLLQSISKEKQIAILVSSHILAEVEKVCDTIAIINDGKIAQIRKVNDFTALANEEERISIKVDYPNYAAKIIKEKENIPVNVIANNVIFKTKEQNIPNIVKLLISKNISIFETKVEKKTLEEIFIDTVGTKKSSIK